MSSYMEIQRRRIAQLDADYRASLAKSEKSQPAPKLDYAAIVTAWWNSMAPTVRHHPWSLEVIAQAAFSNQPRRPAMRCLAEALRTLRFTEKRDWTRAGRNRRMWLPPEPAI